MRFPTSRGGPICDFDRTVTPMVDVVFQLLVFFVLASGGRIAEKTLPAALPSGVISSPVARTPDKPVTELWIHLKRDRSSARTRMTLNGREYADTSSLRDALAKLAHTAPDAVAILDAAGDVPWGDVITANDACRAAHLPSVNFAAAPDELQAAR